MTQLVSYLVDLTSYKFEEGKPTWIQALPLGTWHHPQFGEITVTPERVARFAANVNGGVRGQDLNIDYDHQTGEAAGWVRAAEDRAQDGLWLSVEWTPTARSQLQEKKYRYFSPEYQDEWEHPATKAKLSDVLFGGALTNRPFLKGIMPINLSEAFAEANKGGAMSGQQGTPPAGTPAHGTPVHITGVGPIGQTQAYGDPAKPVMLDEKALMEIPFIKALLERVNNQDKLLAEQRADLQLSELAKPNAKNQVLSPAALAEAKKALAEPGKATEALQTLLGQIRDGSALVQLGEQGGARTSLAEKDATKTLMEAVTQYQLANKCDYMSAVNAVSRQRPDLVNAYGSAVMES